MRSNTSNVLVAFLTIVTLVALTGYQVTSETAAVRLLGRLGGALIEIDRWLPAHGDDLELLARDRPDQPVVLPGLPLDVAIPAAGALEAPAPVLEATIVRAMGHKLYDDGHTAIHDEKGESHLEITEPLRWTIDGLDASAHSFWRLALIVAGLALLLICVAHFWTRQSPLPGLAVGSAVASIGALVMWLAVSALGSSVSGAIDQEIARVVKDAIWIGLRNSLAATGIALGGLYVYSTLFGTHHDDWEQWDDFDYDAYDPDAEARKAPPY